MAEQKATTAAVRGFANVNRISIEEAELKHIDDISSALIDVASYQGIFEGESDSDARKRRKIKTVASGSPGDVSLYFQQLRPGKYEGLDHWETIFTLYNELQGLSSVVASDDEEEVEDKETEDSITNKTKGDNKMSEPKVKGIGDVNGVLQEAINGGQNPEKGQDGIDPEKGQDGIASMPVSESSAEATKAAKDVVFAEVDLRKEKTATTTITALVVAKPPSVKVLVNGLQATGKPSNPDRAYTTFIEKSGYEVKDPDSEIPEFTWTKIVNDPDNVENAKKMLAILQAAKESNDKEIPAYVTETQGPIKAVMLSDPKGAAEVKTLPDLLTFLLNQTAGYIKSTVPNVQAIVAKAKTKTNTVAPPVQQQGNGVDRGSTKKVNPYAGLATVSFSERKEGLAVIQKYVYEINDKVTLTRTNVRSALAVKYIRKAKVTSDLNGKDLIGTFRIPLETLQYELVINNPDFKVLESTGVRGTQPINAEDADAVNAQMEEMAKLIGAVATSNAGKKAGLFPNVRSAIGTLQDEKTEVQTDIMGDLAEGI